MSVKVLDLVPEQGLDLQLNPGRCPDLDPELGLGIDQCAYYSSGFNSDG